MARILICHVPKDGSLARELGAALMGRGHFVSFDGEPDSARPDRSARMRQFEAVAVLWTEASAHSSGLSDIAREALPLNLLVPVRAPELSLTRLPLSFRKLSMPAPRDVDGIARIVARLSTAASSMREFAERVARKPAAAPSAPAGLGRPTAPVQPAKPEKAAAAPQPQPQPQPQPTGGPWPAVSQPVAGTRVRPLLDLPDVETVLASPAPLGVPPAPSPEPPPPAPSREAAPLVETAPPTPPRAFGVEELGHAVDAGLLTHHLPAAMWLGAPTTVEITLGREVLTRLFPARSGPGGGQGLETLSISLYGSGDAFEIERQSERTQFVSVKHALASHDPATFGRWIWLVTPLAAGPNDVVIRISALMRDARGVPVPLALPDRRLSIDVQVPEEESFSAAFATWRTN